MNTEALERFRDAHHKERCEISNAAHGLASQLMEMLEEPAPKTFFVCGSHFQTQIKVSHGRAEVSHMDSIPYYGTPAQLVMEARASRDVAGIMPIDKTAYALLNQGTNLRPADIWLPKSEHAREEFIQNGLYL